MDFLSYAGKINRMCEVAKIDQMTTEDYKCPMYALALRVQTCRIALNIAEETVVEKSLLSRWQGPMNAIVSRN